MALLLAMYQKMRLIREKNQLVLEQSQLSSKQKRIQKNIDKTQKYYTSLFTKLDQDAKRMQNAATISINSIFGFGTTQMGMNPYNYSGLSQNALMTMQQCLMTGQGTVVNEADKNKYIASGLYQETTDVPQEIADRLQAGQVYLAPVAMYSTQAQALIQEYIAGTLTPYHEPGSTAQAETPEGLKRYGRTGAFNEFHINLFNAAKGYATQQESIMRGQCSDMQMSANNNINTYIEAKRAELEEQQDAALDPLNYEDTMLDLEIQTKDMRLKRIEQELDTYKQLCDNEIKNSTPTFGLG